MIAILGAGKMGEALISGLLRAGRNPADVVVVVRRPARADQLRDTYGVAAQSAADAVKTAETLVIAVKPQDMSVLLDEIAPHVPADRLVISVAAGIPTGLIERRLGAEIPVVRVMSNTPVHVDEAMSVISAGRHAGEEHLRRTAQVVNIKLMKCGIVEALDIAATAHVADAVDEENNEARSRRDTAADRPDARMATGAPRQFTRSRRRPVDSDRSRRPSSGRRRR